MKTIRIANAGGFWGDWLEAPRRQVLGGPINYLTIDYLAELTMSMLARQRQLNSDRGYVFDFVRMLDELLPEIASRNIKVVANAGGVNLKGCAEAVKKVADKHGIKIKIALISGDDLMNDISSLRAEGETLKHLETGASFSEIELKLQSANVYLGSQPIVDALQEGADIVITGRISDAALTLAPLRYEFDWREDDWNSLALGVVLGHIIECGAQATGGNCSEDWKAISNFEEIGFPIIEVSANGKAVVTKHPGTGGTVTLGTVKEQLLYEIGDPTSYISPDVIADFTSIKLSQDGPDRVSVSDVKGKPAPDKLKASLSYFAGYRAEGTLLLSWPDAVEKAEAVDRIIRKRISHLKLDDIHTELIGYNSAHGKRGEVNKKDVAEVLLRIAVRSEDKKAVERFTREMPPLVLSGPPGISGYAGDRPGAQEIYAYWPTLVSRKAVIPKLEYYG